MIGRPQLEFGSLSISPAGDRVVAKGRRGGTEAIWIHGESTARALIASSDVDAPAWSPRDDRIAYVASDNGTQRLFIASAASGEAVGLEGVPDGLRPSWTPDAKALVYQSSGGVWLMPADPAATPRQRRRAGRVSG